MRRHYYIILDANAPEALDIYTRLDGNDHTLFQQGLFTRAQTRHFMNFDSQPVPCAVGEIADAAKTPQDFACCKVHIAGFRARPNGRFGSLLGFQNGAIETSNPTCSPSQENGASHIAAVAAQYSTLVKDDQLVFLE